ncbi:MAG: hypothetical protein ACFFFC_18985 [Candidatus Thorarchaeota archaeon]
MHIEHIVPTASFCETVSEVISSTRVSIAAFTSGRELRASVNWSPLFWDRYWLMAGCVVPSNSATFVWDMEWFSTSSLARRERIAGSIAATMVSHGGRIQTPTYVKYNPVYAYR